MAYCISKQSELPEVACNILPNMDPLTTSTSLYSTRFSLNSSHTGLLVLPQALCICRSLCLEYSSYRPSQGWLILTIQISLTIYAKKTKPSSSHLKCYIILFHCHVRVVLYVFTFIHLLFGFCVFPLEFGHSLKQILNT